RGTQVWDRSIDHGIWRNVGQQVGLISQSGPGDSLPLLLENAELTEQCQISRGMLAPGQIILNGHSGNVAARSYLSPRLEFLIVLAVRDLDRSFDDRDPRSLGSVIYHEDGALRGHQAIIGRDVETAGRAMRGFDNDVPAIQVDGGAAPSARDGELRALVHLDLGTIAQFDLGTGVFASAKF